MQIRKRGRPRKVFTDLGSAENQRTLQDAAFPSSESEPIGVADNLNRDATEKKKVADAAKAIPEIFTAAQVVWVFDIYVAALCFIYSIALKTDFTELQKELEFSQEQKEALAEPLAKICSKYAPSEWAGMSAEIQLVTTLGVYTVASFQRAKNVARREEEKKRDATRTRPVAPMRMQPQDEVHVPA